VFLISVVQMQGPLYQLTEKPCNPKTNCYCVYYLLKELKDTLLHEFKKKATIGMQKQYVYGMLSSSSDDDGYLRCFKVSENLFAHAGGWMCTSLQSPTIVFIFKSFFKGNWPSFSQGILHIQNMNN
jgi:hypothetical protein